MFFTKEYLLSVWSHKGQSIFNLGPIVCWTGTQWFWAGTHDLFTRWVPGLTITIRNKWERTDTFKRVFKNSYVQLQFYRHESALDTKIPEKGGSWHGWWTWLVAADLISAAPLCFHSQHTLLPLVCQARLWRPQLGTRPHQSTWHRQSCLSGDWIQTRQLLLATKWRGGWKRCLIHWCKNYNKSLQEIT